MKTSIFNGLNTGKLDFNYNIRYRPRINVTPLAMKRQIEYLLKGIDYEHAYYVWENDKFSKHKHSHSLIKTGDENLIIKLKDNILCNKEPIIEYRKLPIIRERNLTSLTNGIKKTTNQYTWENVEGTKITGKHGELYIEPILSNVAASIYTNKYTDHGANFGYITPLIIKSD